MRRHFYMLRRPLIVIGISICIITAFAFSLTGNNNKVGFINMDKVFDGVTMTRSLQIKIDQISAKRKSIIDSLELDLKMTENKIKADRKNYELVELFQIKRSNLLKRSEQFDEDNIKMIQSYNQQILDHISQKAELFRVEAGLTMIYGKNRNQVVIAADPSLDFTDDLIDYINSEM